MKYNISLLDKKYINNVLQCFNYEISSLSEYPSYNRPDENSLFYCFKNPPKGLIGAYFKLRNNIFLTKYPFGQNLYTLEDILKNSISISEAFIFWDQTVNFRKKNVQIEVIKFDEILDNEQDIINKVNHFLQKNNFISQPLFIKLGCYNIAPNKGIIAPLPSDRNYNNENIDIIYFDEGFRVTEPYKGTINDLINLSNGAEKIYLFSFKNNSKKYSTGHNIFWPNEKYKIDQKN